jgi:hypothetical protein
MIRSNSIPSNRSTVEQTVPLLLHIEPCISYARPVSTKIRPKTNTEKSKNSARDVNDIFAGEKTSIYDKSTTVSSMLTSNSTLSRISYSTAELNRFKNSLIKNSFNKKLKRVDNFWSQSSSVFSSPNLANSGETPIQIKTEKKTRTSLPLTFLYDPVTYSSMANVSSSKAAEFNIFRNKLIKNQPHFRQPSTFIFSNFFSHEKDNSLNSKRETKTNQSVSYRLKKLY